MQCECGWTQDDSPWYAHHHHHELDKLTRKVDRLMSQQDEINADVAELQQADVNIQAEIAALQAANPALDLTALKSAADALSAIAPSAPVVTTPADGDQPTA